MERLIQLSKDKDLVAEIRNYLNKTLEKRLIQDTLARKDVSGFADAFEIIKLALNEIENLSKVEKVRINKEVK